MRPSMILWLVLSCASFLEFVGVNIVHHRVISWLRAGEVVVLDFDFVLFYARNESS